MITINQLGDLKKVPRNNAWDKEVEQSSNCRINNMRITYNFLYMTIITKEIQKQNTNFKGKNYVKVPQKNATQ